MLALEPDHLREKSLSASCELLLEISSLLSTSSSSVRWASLKVERIKWDNEHALIPVPAP